jgi:hypothetical protein
MAVCTVPVGQGVLRAGRHTVSTGTDSNEFSYSKAIPTAADAS